MNSMAHDICADIEEHDLRALELELITSTYQISQRVHRPDLMPDHVGTAMNVLKIVRGQMLHLARTTFDCLVQRSTQLLKQPQRMYPTLRVTCTKFFATYCLVKIPISFRALNADVWISVVDAITVFRCIRRSE